MAQGIRCEPPLDLLPGEAARAGLYGLIKCRALELGPFNVRANLIADPEIVAIIRKVQVHSDPEMIDDLWMGARVQVGLTNGKHLETEQLYRKAHRRSR